MTKQPVKVVELSSVTDREMERIINEQIAEGWHLDNIHFAMSESSRRPKMAFLLFSNPDYQPAAAKLRPVKD